MSARAGAVLGAVVAFGFMGTGCVPTDGLSAENTGSAAYNVSDNNSASVDISENKDKENGGTSERFRQAEAIVSEFMDGFLYHDHDVLVQYGGARSLSAYSFLDGVCLTDWEIIDFSDYENSGNFQDNDKIYTFKIKMNISESSSELFPVGESVWFLDVSDTDKSYFSYFAPEGAEKKTILADSVDSLEVSSAVKMCYAYTSAFDWICGDDMVPDREAVDNKIEKERLVCNLLEFCNYFDSSGDPSDNDMSYSAEWLKDSAEKLLGITELDFTGITLYNAGDDTLKNNILKYSWGYATLESEQYDEDNGVHTVVIDWYADTIFLSKAFTVKYTLSDNSDGTMRLLSSEKIYDSGERPLFFTENLTFDQ